MAERGGRRRTSSRAGRPVDESRRAAYDVLTAVREQDAYTNLVLPPMLRSRGLTGRDAAFATELVAGTVRGQGLYRAVLEACVDRSLDEVDAPVLDAMLLGTHQLLAMRVPSHAAVGTTVDLVRRRVGRGPTGFVNAVLRKVAARDLGGWVARVAPDAADDPLGHAAVATSHPRWVVEAFAEALPPAEDGGLDALLAADNAAPAVTLVARPGLSSVDELVAAGGVASAQSPYAVTMPGGDPGAVPAVAEGRAGVQDEGSQLVALALADAPLEGRDQTWLDVCAGPGGKSALLAALAGQRGARVLANERLPHRSLLVQRATAAVGAGLLGVVTGDGTRPAWRPGSVDRVLVDAPCSGLGALRRRPEARWRRRPEDLDALVPLQRRLLEQALDAVRPGGVVLYATCSPVLAESRDVVSAVAAGRDDASLVDVRPMLPGVPRLGEGPTVQLWPHVHGTDAMFLALWRRGGR